MIWLYEAMALPFAILFCLCGVKVLVTSSKPFSAPLCNVLLAVSYCWPFYSDKATCWNFTYYSHLTESGYK